MPGDLDIKFTWVASPFLAENRVNGWSNMPVWVPARAGNEGWSRVSIAKTVAAGLTFRPLPVTSRDTLAWWRSLPPERQAKPKTGLTPEREAALLAEWKREPAGR